MFEGDQGGEEMGKAGDLGTAVYHTETGVRTMFSSLLSVLTSNAGADLRQLTMSQTYSLGWQFFTLLLHWAQAANFLQTASHDVDYCPGSLSGVGPMVARSLNGRGTFASSSRATR